MDIMKNPQQMETRLQNWWIGRGRLRNEQKWKKQLQSVQNVFLWLNMQTFDFLVAAVVVIREFKIYDTTVAKTSLKIASSSSSTFLLIISVCLTFES